jgi:hypothetical protein
LVSDASNLTHLFKQDLPFSTNASGSNKKGVEQFMGQFLFFD